MMPTLSVSEGLNMFKLERKSEVLHRMLGVSTGSSPITLLGFLATMRDALDTVRATEALGMQFNAHHFED